MPPSRVSGESAFKTRNSSGELGERDRVSGAYFERRCGMPFFQENLKLTIAVDEGMWCFPITFAVTADQSVNTVTSNTDDRTRPFSDRSKFFELHRSKV
jgi:hypothetical protein